MIRSAAFLAVLAVPVAVAANQPGGGPVRGVPSRTELPAAGAAVPMEMTRGKIVVQAKVNGRGPFPFLLDTGAGANVLNDDLARELGLESLGKTGLGDPANPQSIEADVVSLDAVHIGDAVFHGVGAVAWDRGGLYGGPDAPRGVLGYPLLADCLLTIDYPGEQVRIARGELPAADGREILDYRLEAGGIPVFDIQIAGQTYPSHIDTGAMSGLSVPPEWEEKFALSTPAQVVGRARTASKEYEIRAGTLAGELRIGSQVFTNPEIAFSGALKTANLGSRLLRDFRLTFDLPNKRVRFERAAQPPPAVGAALPTPPPADRPRLGIMAERAMDGEQETLTITQVMPDTPAARAGLRSGDILLRINGRPATGAAMQEELSKSRRVRLQVRRGEKIENVAVELTAGNEAAP